MIEAGVHRKLPYSIQGNAVIDWCNTINSFHVSSLHSKYEPHVMTSDTESNRASNLEISKAH